MEYKRLKEKLETILTLPELPFEEDLTAVDCKQIYNILCKIEQGTLIELPCKVGDMVYFAVNNGWDCAEIDEIHIFKDDIVFEWVQYDRGYELTELWDCGDFSIKDIGKTVFLTREEAEKRLKELQDEHKL
jgi:hypothetical protein